MITDGPLEFGLDLRSVIRCDPDFTGEVRIPGDIRRIEDSAFRDCRIAAVHMSGVEIIGDDAFRGCANLASVRFGDGLERISRNAFRDCISLKSADFPESLERIGRGAFRGCASMESIDIPDGVERIGDLAFSGCTGLVAAALPPSMESLGAQMFAGCSSLKSVRLPRALRSIPDGMFSRCVSLGSVRIPRRTESIGAFAFSACTRIRSARIPPNVGSIGKGAFTGCDRLNRVTFECRSCADLPAFDEVFALAGTRTGGISIKIGDEVSRIPANLFRRVPSIRSVAFPENMPDIGPNAFEGCVFRDRRNRIAPVEKMRRGRRFEGPSSDALVEIATGTRCGRRPSSRSPWTWRAHSR